MKKLMAAVLICSSVLVILSSCGGEKKNINTVSPMTVSYGDIINNVSPSSDSSNADETASPSEETSAETEEVSAS